MRTLVMRRAWEIKREDFRNIFSECLKMAWAEIKADHEYRMMIPSRKQVGVIYAAFKNGLVNVSNELISEMYQCIRMHEDAVYMNQEDYTYNECAIIGKCVNAAFAGDYGFVERELKAIA